MAAGPTWAAWVEGLGTGRNAIPSTQMMSGAGRIPTGEFVVAGLATNWTSGRISLTGSPASLRLEEPGVGLYSTRINGPFSADRVGIDFLNLNEDLAGACPTARLA